MSQRPTNQEIDRWVRDAVLGADEATRNKARATIWARAIEAGAWSASIHDLYMAMGRGEVSGFTVPAINVRGLTYDFARAVFRAARAREVGAFIFEIARSEIGYTFQRPAEFSAAVLAGAMREGWTGPVFLQGDHFQFSAKKHADDPAAETKAVADLTREAIEGGFRNIDIDSSTLVDLSFATVEEQQRVNGERGAEMTAVIRACEPKGVTVSVGGEIGEVGKKNSTVEELTAYMGEYQKALSRRGVGLVGISKVSVQTGTSHGGIPLPDGSVAEVKLDFDTLARLSKLAREKWGMSGAVQHGASTLPAELFHKFPEVGTAEIHLATEFQNMMYDGGAYPSDLKKRVYDYLRTACADERKATDSDEQFFYKTRKKGFGPFKADLCNLPQATRDAILAPIEKKIAYLFEQLKVVGTARVVEKHVRR
ncbi:MAG: class II fructose-bisphosphate aldolase [Deltaproteobacteria bacterium]|nr:class II fructose-bisphosphate aldolase [Deltaproteobacteria bacterium]